MTSPASQFRLLVAVVALAALALAVPAHAGITDDLPFRVADQAAWLDSKAPYFSSLFPSTLRGCLRYYSPGGDKYSNDCSSVIGKGWKNPPELSPEVEKELGTVYGGDGSPGLMCYWCPPPNDVDSVYKW